MKGNPTRPAVCTLNCSLVESPKPCKTNVTMTTILRTNNTHASRLQLQSSLFSEGSLKDLNTYGSWVSGCGKFFMFSTEKVYNSIKYSQISTVNILGKLDNSTRYMLLNWTHFGDHSHYGEKNVHGQNDQ
jgi:hypothetical protein